MKKNPYKGKFIAFEGLDGSGQTTQVNLLKDYLIRSGFEVVSTKEPTWDNEAGKWVNNTLHQNKKLNSEELKLLQEKFAEDRNWHQKNIIEPALKEGKIVITDRSQFSSFAFGAASGVDLNYLFSLNEKFIEPDVIMLLKVSPKICLGRIHKRGEKQTLFEKEKQLEKVWDIYEKLAKKFKNIVVVNGEKPIEEIHKNIKILLTERGLIKS
jgi:dTMP kinase